MSHFADDETLTHIAALEAEVMRLREVIFDMAGEEPGISWGKADKVLSTTFTPTALNELVERVEKRTIERCAVVCNSKLIPHITFAEHMAIKMCAAAIRKLGEQ